MNRERISAFKRVMRDWRDAGAPDTWIAEHVTALLGTRCDPFDLDRALASSAVGSVHAFAAETSETPGPAARGL